VVSKLSVVKFSKFFEIYFFRSTLKEPIVPKKIWVYFYSNKDQRFPIFSKPIKKSKTSK
jgi:hypothetical protein